MVAQVLAALWHGMATSTLRHRRVKEDSKNTIYIYIYIYAIYIYYIYIYILQCNT